MIKSNFLTFFTVMQLYKNRVHLGVKSNLLSTEVFRYLLPIKGSFSLFDLNYSAVLLKTSFHYLTFILKRRGSVLIVNESAYLSSYLKKEFEQIPQPVSYQNWPAGLLSNFKSVRSNSLKTYFLKKQFILHLFQLDSLGLLNSKLRNSIKSSFNFLKFRKELKRYIKNLNRIPNAMFVFDSLISEIALKEGKSVGVTLLGIADSNSKSFDLNYAVPGNSSSLKSLLFYLNFLKLIFVKSMLLEKRSFLVKCLNKKKSYRGLNFFFKSEPLSSIRNNLAKFYPYFLKKGYILNPFLDLYQPSYYSYKQLPLLTKILKSSVFFEDFFKWGFIKFFSSYVLTATSLSAHKATLPRTPYDPLIPFWLFYKSSSRDKNYFFSHSSYLLNNMSAKYKCDSNSSAVSDLSYSFKVDSPFFN